MTEMNLEEDFTCILNGHECVCGFNLEYLKQQIITWKEKAEKWDSYYEPQYDLRPTYQVLEQELAQLK